MTKTEAEILAAAEEVARVAAAFVGGEAVAIEALCERALSLVLSVWSPAEVAARVEQERQALLLAADAEAAARFGS